MNTGVLIAAAVAALYLIFGPIILLAIYAFFDRMADKKYADTRRSGFSMTDKDPALWTARDVLQYMEKQDHFLLNDFNHE